MLADRDALIAAVLSAYDMTLRTTEAVSPTLDAHGLTFATAYVLWAIDPNEQPPSMGTVAERTRCAPSNLTFLCDQLESRGLITREASTTDRRQRVVRLTAAGRAAREAVIAGTVEASPLNALSPEDVKELLRLLGSTTERD